MNLKARFDRLGGLASLKGDAYLPVPEAEIVGLERALGATLPELYRVFLLTFGASCFQKIVEFSPVQRLPPSVSSDGRGFVDMFYGAAAQQPNDLSGMFELYRPRMPERFLPIGGDGGGDQIAMIVGGDESGTIYYWNHHAEWDEEDYLEDGLPIPANLKWQNVTTLPPPLIDSWIALPFVLKPQGRSRLADSAIRGISDDERCFDSVSCGAGSFKMLRFAETLSLWSLRCSLSAV